MATLERLEAGGFSINKAFSIPELEALNEEERLSELIPTESLFEALPKICLPEFFEKLCRGGCEIYQKKIHTSLPLGSRVRLADTNGNFFALGEVREYENGSAIKSIKIFEL